MSLFGHIARKISDEGNKLRPGALQTGIEQFVGILNGEEEIRVFVDGTVGMGHQGSSVHIMFRIIFRFGFKKTIRVVYKPGDAETGSTVTKLTRLIPGLTEEKIAGDGITVEGASIKFTKWEDRGTLEPVQMGFTGGADGDDNFAVELKTEYFLKLQPYGWETISPQQIQKREAPPELIPDLNNRAFYFDNPTLSEEDWATMEGALSGDAKKRVQMAKVLFEKRDDIYVMPVYGIRDKNMQIDGSRPEGLLATLLFAARKLAVDSHLDKPVVLLNIGDVGALEEDKETIKPGSTLDKLNKIIDGSYFDTQKTELIHKRNDYAKQSAPWKRYNKSAGYYVGGKGFVDTFNVSTEVETVVGEMTSVTPATLQSKIEGLAGGKVLFLQLGGLPVAAYNYFYFQAGLPGAFEGQGTVGMAMCFGKPYTHLPKSSATEGRYPRTVISPDVVVSTCARDCEKSVNSILNVLPINNEDQNLTGPEVAMKADEIFTRRIERISLFLSTVSFAPGSDTAKYFAAVKSYYGDEENDRFLVAVNYLNGQLPHVEMERFRSLMKDESFFSKMYSEIGGLNSLTELHFKDSPLPQNVQKSLEKMKNEESALEKLYNRIKEKETPEKEVDLLECLEDGKIKEFYSSIVTGKTLLLKGVKTGEAFNKDGKLKRVFISGSTEDLGMLFQVDKIDFTSEPSGLLSKGHFICRSGTWELEGVPWIVMEQPSIDIVAFDSSVPPAGKISGFLPAINTTISLDFPIQTQWVVTGTMAKPYPSIASAYAIAGGINLVSSLPEPLSTFVDLGISRIGLIYDQDKKSLGTLSFDIEPGSKTSWELIPNLTVHGLKIGVTVENPADLKNRSVGVTAEGSVTIGEGTVTIGTRFPDFLVEGNLSKGEIYLKDLIKLLIPFAETDFTSRITDFGFSVHPSDSNYSFHGTIESDWPIEVAGKNIFMLKSMSLAINSYGKNPTGMMSANTEILPEDPDFRIAVFLCAKYLGKDEGWVFEGRQTDGKLPLGKLVKCYLGWDTDQDYGIDGLGVVIETATNSYTFTGKTAEWWEIPFPIGENPRMQAEMLLKYRAQKKETKALALVGEEDVAGLAGTLNGRIQYYGIDLTLFFDFNPKSVGFGFKLDSITGRVEKKSVKGTDQWIGTLSFGNISLGGMIEKFIGWATGQKFGLSAPWNILNHINLDSFELVFNFTTKKVSFNYDIGSINLGFANIEKIGVCYVPEGEDKGVNVELIGSFIWQTGDSLGWDATKPEETPAPPGGGNKYFDLRLLSLGQHVGIYGSASFQSVEEAIEKIRKMAVPKGREIPVSFPPKDGQPYYNPDSSWLIATDFGILKLDPKKKDSVDSESGQGYMLSLSAIFNDPNLYALRVALAGEQAKIFKGLDFEIMYRRISDTVGVYSTEVTLPDIMRQIDVGAYSITLPVFGIEIYTNGDFKVDIGFPYNFDFTRSFTVQGIVYPGIPVLGSGGFYFGKLSSATCNRLPQTDRGTFNPVLIFGFGMQVGVGKYIEKGILRAGFSITATGMLEGLIAKWNPNLPATDISRNQVQDTYYFWIQGTAGILGKLFGSVDFAIIKAEVNVEVKVLAQITFESYAPIPISVMAEVKIQLAVKINLGLFKIKIKFKFHAKIKETFTIENGGRAPWAEDRVAGRRSRTNLMKRRLTALRGFEETLFLAGAEPFAMHWSNLAPRTSKVSLTTYMVPFLTMCGDEAKCIGEQKASYIPFIFMESSDPDSAGFNSSDSSFETLCSQVFLWTVAAALPKGSYTSENVAGRVVTDRMLSAMLTYLSGGSDGSMILPQILSVASAEKFMGDQFAMKLSAPTHNEEKSGTVFAMPRLMGLDVPSSTSKRKYTFDEFSKADRTYLGKLGEYFRELEVIVQDEMKRDKRFVLLSENDFQESIAGFIFSDYFVMIAKQMVQSAKDLLRTCPMEFDPELSIKEIVDLVNRKGELAGENVITAEDLFESNESHAFTPGKTVYIAPPSHEVEEGDTIKSIADKHTSFTPSELAEWNAVRKGILKAGSVITVSGKEYTVKDGDSFVSIALSTSEGDIEKLFIDSDIADVENLLIVGADLTVEPSTYSVKSGDTFESIAAAYDYSGGKGLSVDNLANSNIAVKNLFVPNSEIKFREGESEKTYTVSSSDTLLTIARAVSGGNLEKLFSISDISAKEGLLKSLSNLLLPTIAGVTADQDSPASLAAKFDVPVSWLAHDKRNVSDLKGFFQKEKDGDFVLLNITHLVQYRVDELLDVMKRGKDLQQISGMISRFYLHGLRLPKEISDGKTTGKITFMDGVDLPDECGLYRITGQQFELPDFNVSNADPEPEPWSFSLTRPDDYGWIHFDGDKSLTSITVTPDKNDIAGIEKVKNFATKQGLKPECFYLGVDPAAQTLPTQYICNTPAIWNSASDVVLPHGGKPSASLKLLSLPGSLVNMPEREKSDMLPEFILKSGVYDEATSAMNYQDLKTYGWASVVSFSVKRVPPVSGSPSLAYTYELMGAGENDIVILERLLENSGENLIDKLYILYKSSDKSSYQSGSLSREDFFISQVNLTTETRPPSLTFFAEKAEAVQHQTDMEFIRQLWENSITRSGGYYLYYSDSDEKRGLPDHIFNDKGEATVSLMIMLDKSLGNALPAYANSVVTGDAVDLARAVIFAEPDQTLQHHTVESGEMLNRIAQRYYTTPLQIVERNDDINLAQDAKIGVSDGMYMVGPKDSSDPHDWDRGNPEAIAKHFSITLDDLKAANPKITSWPAEFPLYTVLMLPNMEITPAPGRERFKSIAEYYGTTVADLADANSTRSGLFTSGTTLSLVQGPHVVHSSVPAGAVSVAAKRTTPPEIPDSTAAADYGRIYMENMFSMLGYRVRENDGFRKSNPGLPMAPVDGKGPDGEETGFQLYNQTLPYWKFSKESGLNAIPDSGHNPYRGIGSVLQVDFGWIDMFGNRTITPLDDPTIKSDAPLNGAPILMRYTDPIVGLSQWPAAAASYTVSGDAGKPALEIKLNFDPSTYMPSDKNSENGETPAWKKAAEQALLVYSQLFYQLDGIDFSFSTSIVKAEKIEFTDAVLSQSVESWVGSICEFLYSQCQEGTSVGEKSGAANPPAPLTIRYDIDENQIRTEEILPLTATINMARESVKVDPQFAETPNYLKSVTSVEPAVSKEQTGGSVNISKFVADFEKAFSGYSDFELKVMSGVDRDSYIKPGGKKPLWIVRAGKGDENGISCSVGDAGKPRILVPRPVRNSLESRSDVDIFDYVSGKGIDFTSASRKLNFTGVDTDLWLKSYLSAVDNFLSPQFTTPLGILADRKGRDYLSEIKELKKVLADNLKELLIPVFKGETVTAVEQEKARETFKQKMLIRLDSCYSTDAVMQFHANVVSDLKTSDNSPRFFGTPVRKENDNRNFTVSSGKIGFKPDTEKGESLLNLVLSTAQGQMGLSGNEVKSYLPLDLKYRVSDIEHQIGSLPGIDGYEASSWLAFCGKGGVFDSNLGTFNVPLVLRSFPTPPTMSSQNQLKSVKTVDVDSVSSAASWAYGFTYEQEYHYPQDCVYLTVKFNIRDSLLLDDCSLNVKDLVKNLAEFQTVYPAVEKDLTAFLATIDPENPDQDKLEKAAVAVDSFIELSERVLECNPGNNSGGMNQFAVESASGDVWELSITEHAEKIEGVDALVVRLHGSIPDSNVDPSVLIQESIYNPVAVKDDEGWAWYYTEKESGKILSAEDGRKIPGRTVVFPELNILSKQDAWASVHLSRNRNLMPDPKLETADPFVYTTSEIKFANPLHPRIDSIDPIEIERIDSPSEPRISSLAEHLGILFKALFKSVEGSTQTILMECGYSYSLNKKLPPVVLPVFFLPSTVMDIESDTKSSVAAGEDKPLVVRIEEAVMKWFDENVPLAMDGVVRFDLTVISDMTRQQVPLLRLRNLTLDIDHIKPEPKVRVHH